MQNAECKMQNEQRLIDANALDAKKCGASQTISVPTEKGERENDT